MNKQLLTVLGIVVLLALGYLVFSMMTAPKAETLTFPDGPKAEGMPGQLSPHGGGVVSPPQQPQQPAAGLPTPPGKGR